MKASVLLSIFCLQMLMCVVGMLIVKGLVWFHDVFLLFRAPAVVQLNRPVQQARRDFADVSHQQSQCRATAGLRYCVELAELISLD